MDSTNSQGTLPDRLADIAAAHPTVATTFWSTGQRLEYAELYRLSLVAAAELVRRGIGRGEPVGILCPNAPEFLVSFFAVAAAGGAATPLPLPASTRRAGGYPQQLAAITAAAGMRTVLVSSTFAELVPLLHGSVDVEFVDTALLTEPGTSRLTEAATAPLTEAATAPLTEAATAPLTEAAPAVELPHPEPDDLAVVQFTSGSTALPKGVRLTHRQVLAGLAAIRRGIALDFDDQGGFWLPLFHDMGLFGTLSAILRGIPSHLWSPLSFVKDPARWLREFAASGTTITAMPSFGYEALLAAVDPEQVAEFDLRHWRIAFNGAEPISQEVVSRFLERFAPAGFAPTSMFGVYGMAEATLAVAFPPLGREPVFEWVDRPLLADAGVAEPISPELSWARAVAGVGAAVDGLELRVVSTDGGIDLPDGHVGEILIRGASVTEGYLTADSDSVADRFVDGWLRTGDLGYLRTGELFVTGRCKDMITVRGVNHYAQDVEAAVADLDGIYKGRCTAAADPDGADVIAVIAETECEGAAADALTRAIKDRIAADLGLAAVDVHLVPPRTIPRTSSGKLRRLAARDLIGVSRAQL
ncbi:AMP-binding protein [Nocardia sp. CDC153]|uniref:AMP-binding protein n=1 Tax=Nocardia sp. CDC153 TaxID=3112167 RepID=UPI002DB803D0|nr:AMP-binding protein [Nocardia sp. CDC153]MEC3955961.1 AMP-binding protein [Nocardia sp. CDC153]